MTPPKSTPLTFPIDTKTVLAKNGFRCSILTLPAGDGTPLYDADSVEEHVLFAIDGEVTVRFADLNVMLKKDDAVLIANGQAHRIAASPDACAKLLRVEAPPRRLTQHLLTVIP